MKGLLKWIETPWRPLQWFGIGLGVIILIYSEPVIPAHYSQLGASVTSIYVWFPVRSDFQIEIFSDPDNG